MGTSLENVLEEANTILLRCEFGLQPEFYGGKDNGSLKDVRCYLKKYNPDNVGE